MPSSQLQSKLNSLLIRATKGNPELTDLMQEIINETQRLGFIIDPPPVSQIRISSETFTIPSAPTDFTYYFTTRNVFLTWVATTADVVYYELRKGATWDSATRILVTAERQVILEPLTEGSHTYLIKALSIDGQYSVGTAEVTIVVPAVGSVNITSITIDQNVLLYWNVPTSTFAIAYYIVTRNGSDLFTVTGTFAAIVELISDTYTFGVIPVDIAGNQGPEATIQVIVAGPPDFVLQAEFDSTLSGTATNAIDEGDRLLLPVTLGETWADHFINNSWATPQDQVNAGYPLYIQPTPITASYEEVFDVGLIYPSTIISISWNVSVITGSFTIGVSTRVSDDGISWSSPQTGQNIYVESVRYIEVTVDFTGSDDTALMEFYNLHVSVAVKQSMDSGEVNAIASDPLGTFVAFNVPFKDVNSITLTADSTKEEFICIHEFDDVPNPTGFNVFAYDTSGVRKSIVIDWKVRGII